MTRSPFAYMQRLLVWSALIGCLAFMPGCAYGDRIKREGAAPSGEYVALVQNAVEQYQSKTGVLPIRNKDTNASEYERYPVDFGKLQNARTLTAVPPNAYENGGMAIYVLIRIETKPQVKLLDLAAYQRTSDLQKEIEAYKSAHKGSLPKGEEISPGYWSVDFAKLGRAPATIRSPYSNRPLGFALQQTGKVGIDYAPDIMQAIGKKGLRPDPKSDLRELLLDDASFVPVCSFPYRWTGDTPSLSLF